MAAEFVPVSGSPPVRGLFVGLATLDLVQRVSELPGPNKKVTALRQDIAGGGPALNAAVLFAALGGQARLVTRLGSGGIARLIAADLAESGVELVDVAEPGYRPAMSSIAIQHDTGDRQIISTDAVGGPAGVGPSAADGGSAAADGVDPPAALAGRLPDLLAGVDLVHLDGHHPDLALAAAGAAADAGVLRLLDAGRWKPVMPQLIPLCTDVVCSADFRPPEVAPEQVLDWLLTCGVTAAGITDGPRPVRWRTRAGGGEVAVPAVDAVDTLGAGDFFHGAYGFARAGGSARNGETGSPDPVPALHFAARVAGLKCRFPGTREWLAALAEVAPAGPGTVAESNEGQRE